jgi:hypothetical protein
MKEPLTEAQITIMWHQFESNVCPVCSSTKQRRWCFCRTCYFALKHAQPKLAAGLWYSALDENDRFFEGYQAAKTWLSKTGLRGLKNDKGGLFDGSHT